MPPSPSSASVRQLYTHTFPPTPKTPYQPSPWSSRCTTPAKGSAACSPTPRRSLRKMMLPALMAQLWRGGGQPESPAAPVLPPDPNALPMYVEDHMGVMKKVSER